MSRFLRFSLALILVVVAALFPFAAHASIGLGVYIHDEWEDPSLYSNYVNEVGRPPAILHNYRDFLLPFFYSNEAQTYKSKGVIPLITWEPYGPNHDEKNTVPLADIAAGDYDNVIDAAADQARDYGSLIYLRFAHEMNGDWYGWSSRTSGNTPQDYVAAWRHIVDIFRARGATNVKFVWCPNVMQGPNILDFTQYYPGTDYVDVLALDGYNWGGSEWQSLHDVFAYSMSKLEALGPQPIMIAETSSAEAGGSKGNWIRTGFLQTIPNDFPRVFAVVWFEMNDERDWRIESSSDSLAAYQEVANSTLYGGTIPPPLFPTPNPLVPPVTVKVTPPHSGMVVIRIMKHNGGAVSVHQSSVIRRCTANCQIKAAWGSRLLLHAKPKPGYRFKGWRRSCRGHKINCSLQIRQQRHLVVARFLKTP